MKKNFIAGCLGYNGTKPYELLSGFSWKYKSTSNSLKLSQTYVII